MINMEWIVQQYNKNKKHLKEYFKKHKQEEYSDYNNLIKILVKEIINRDAPECLKLCEKIKSIKHGRTEGHIIYLLHRESKNPCILDYYMFDIQYNTDPLFDSLLKIQKGSKEYPTDDRINKYLSLCLEIIKSIRSLYTTFI